MIDLLILLLLVIALSSIGVVSVRLGQEFINGDRGNPIPEILGLSEGK